MAKKGREPLFRIEEDWLGCALGLGILAFIILLY